MNIELLKRQIDIQMAEFEQAIADAIEWHKAWKSRQPKGFKIKKKPAEISSTETGV